MQPSEPFSLKSLKTSLAHFALLILMTLTITACGGGGGGGGNSAPASGSGSPTTAPSITAQPQSRLVNDGVAATFNVVANGTAPLSYQWRRDGSDIGGATSASYALNATTLADSGAQFTVVVSNSAGSATSSIATLTVNAVAPSITTQPLAQTVLAGSTATFSVVVAGSGPLSFQWRKNGVAISNAVNANYVIPTTTLSDSGAAYDVIVTNIGGSQTSNTALLTVTTTPNAVTILSQPQNASVNEGDSATFSVSASGTGPFSYQWRRNGVAIPGAYAANYTISPATRLNSGDQYLVDITNASGGATSNVATLAVVNAQVGLVAGSLGGSGNIDGVGGAARFFTANSVVTDHSGNIYVADYGNHAIRKISTSGTVSLFAGSPGQPGWIDGSGIGVRFNFPAGVTIDNTGNLYVADSGNYAIRKISSTGNVTTLAGSVGNPGSVDGTGTSAQFGFQSQDWHQVGIVVDTANNIFVADTPNHTIRKITPSGVVTTFAGTAGQTGLVDGTGSAARFNRPNGLAIDASDNIYVADTLNGKIRKISSSGMVSTMPGGTGVAASGSQIIFAGPPLAVAADSNGNVYASQDFSGGIWRSSNGGAFNLIAGGPTTSPLAIRTDGFGTSASFLIVYGLAVDSAGNLIVADSISIRKISPQAQVSTIAGNLGLELFGHTDGAIKSATFGTISGLSVDPSGNTYIAIGNQGTIRKITPTGIVSTFAGSLTGQYGSDDGIGNAAKFAAPNRLVADSAGTIYLSDSGNHNIRKIASDGNVTTIAGLAGTTGTANGLFNQPGGLAADSSGNIYVADSNNHVIRKISSSGTVTTLAGTAGTPGALDGTGNAARFQFPTDIAIDAADNLFVTDTTNHAIRKITPAGVVTTLAGSLNIGASGAVDGTGTAARFSTPEGIAIDSANNLYVTDIGNHNIRKITPTGIVSTVAGDPALTGVKLGALPGAFSTPTAITVIPSVSGTKLLVVDEGAILSVTLP